MSASDSDATMAVFLDLENIALGAHEAGFPPFDVRKLLERLLLKGHIVVKKAYCDFERYKTFKRGLHEAAFELIEIPHVRQSGKNSADIRMVVDALDLCYTKSHVDSFVIISGDSDFSPLVSKLRENDKTVIGVGVKQSTSDLFISNCDEFIYYDDLVRVESARKERGRRAPTPNESTAAQKEAPRKIPPAPSAGEALELLAKTLDALRAERGAEYEIRGSLIKQAMKRQWPGFNERAHGFKAFNDLLLEAQERGLLKLERDKQVGTYIVHALD
ncbi:MAG: NYN domain-containing protein [Chthoniobacterales bacterium]|nr:NYN domain-containing protein [Chthoniobacterales bacterium]